MINKYFQYKINLNYLQLVKKTISANPQESSMIP